MWLDPSGHWRMSLTGHCRLSALWLFHEPGLWNQCSFSKARAIPASGDSSRWLTVTSLFWLVIKTPEATLHCVQIREATADSFVSLDSLLRVVDLFHAEPSWNELSHQVCVRSIYCSLESQNIFFHQPSKPCSYLLRFLTDRPLFGGGGEKNFNLIQKPSEVLPNGKTNSNSIASLFPEEMLLMNKTMRKCKIRGGSGSGGGI